MHLTHACGLFFCGTTLFLWRPGPAVTAVDILGSLQPGDFQTDIAPQSYRDWGNEPSIAVNPVNPQEIVAASFGYGSWISNPIAQLWHSTNGGASWAICFSMPTPFPGSTFFVDDQTFAYDGTGVLHCGLLGYDSTSDSDAVFHGITTNVNNSSAWIWNSTAL